MTDDNTLAIIRELAKLLAETNLSEIEISEKGCSIRVARQMSSVSVSHSTPITHTLATAIVPEPIIDIPPAAPDAASSTPVTSPMVGTAYLSPEPGAPPFISVGTKVTKGQTILIIEAMKTMNPIPAPQDGVVKQIFATNGQPVEYGEVLLTLI